jgi:hypothetical protein
MTAAAVQVTTIELKRCPRCEESLPLSEFGICRARKDGLNLYCKRCIRQKIAQSRQALREYKQARSKHGTSGTPDRPRAAISGGLSPARIARILRKLSPADRVREAIRCGAHTQKEIARVTKLPKDEIGDALANLLLWSREIRTDVVNHMRMYHMNDVAETLSGASAQKSLKKTEHRRQLKLSPSFSSVHDLMPGRKPFARGKKRGTERGQPGAKSKGKSEAA